jgi:hypothetical protein
MSKSTCFVLGIGEILFLLIITFTSCNRQKKADTTIIKKELQERTLVRVTEGQLMDFVGKEGKTIADIVQSSIVINGDNLDLDSSTVKPLIEAYSYDITVKKRQQIDKSSKEFEVWEAYNYCLENELALEDNIQKLGTDLILYNRALASENKLLGLISISMTRKNLVKRISNEKSTRK